MLSLREVENAKWWSKSNPPLFLTAIVYPFLKSFKKDKSVISLNFVWEEFGGAFETYLAKKHLSTVSRVGGEKLERLKKTIGNVSNADKTWKSVKLGTERTPESPESGYPEMKGPHANKRRLFRSV